MRERSHGRQYDYCPECNKHVTPVPSDQGMICPECEFVFPVPGANVSNDTLSNTFSTTEGPLSPVDPGHDRKATPEAPQARPPRGVRSQELVKELVEKALLEIDANWATNPVNPANKANTQD